jgi:hypothetical protein
MTTVFILSYLFIGLSIGAYYRVRTRQKAPVYAYLWLAMGWPLAIMSDLLFREL